MQYMHAAPGFRDAAHMQKAWTLSSLQLPAGERLHSWRKPVILCESWREKNEWTSPHDHYAPVNSFLVSLFSNSPVSGLQYGEMFPFGIRQAGMSQGVAWHRESPATATV